MKKKKLTVKDLKKIKGGMMKESESNSEQLQSEGVEGKFEAGKHETRIDCDNSISFGRNNTSSK